MIENIGDIAQTIGAAVGGMGIVGTLIGAVLVRFKSKEKLSIKAREFIRKQLPKLLTQIKDIKNESISVTIYEVLKAASDEADKVFEAEGK